MSFDLESRSKPFCMLLSLEAQMQSGFSDDPSLIIQHHQRTCRVFLTFNEGADLNLVVIEDAKHRHDGLHRDWYFGTIAGENIAHRTGTDVDDFLQQVHNLISRKNRVAGSSLEDRILATIS